MYSRPFSAFFFSRDIMKKLFRNVHKKIYKFGGLFFKCLSRIKESNNFTKIRCGFFLVYLPNFLVGHLYILLNKKMFARNWRVRVSKFSLLFFAKQLQEGNPLFLILFAYGFPRHSRSVQFVVFERRFVVVEGKSKE